MIDSTKQKIIKDFIKKISLETMEGNYLWIPEQVIDVEEKINENKDKIRSLENAILALKRDIEATAKALAYKEHKADYILDKIKTRQENVDKLKRRIKFLEKDNRRFQGKFKSFSGKKEEVFYLNLNSYKYEYGYDGPYIITLYKNEDSIRDEITYHLTLISNRMTYTRMQNPNKLIIDTSSEFFPELITLGMVLTNKERLAIDTKTSTKPDQEVEALLKKMQWW